MTFIPDTKKMMSHLRYLSPLQRMINSEGLDQSFAYLAEQIPDLIVHEYPAGETCEDWIVPPAWKVARGILTDYEGKAIADINDCPLFVAPYSKPVDGWFDKKAIEKHLRTRPDRPDAFALEHRHAYDYQLNDWGITLPYNIWQAMNETHKYHVKIETMEHGGSMKVGEWIIPGKTAKTICINAHIDELCNDDLSGCVLAMELMAYIQSLPKTRYTYQMLIAPELIGPIFYIKNNMESVKNTIGMLNLESVGAGKKWALKKALHENSHIEKAFLAAFKACKLDHDIIGFFEGYGNDERVYAWPVINIPGVALQRFPFPEYHTSEDTPEIIDETLLKEGFHICARMLDILEQDYRPVYKNTLPPWFTKRRLYFDREFDPEKNQIFNNQIMFNINGKNSILDLANLSGLNFFDVLQYIEKCRVNGIIGSNE